MAVEAAAAPALTEPALRDSATLAGLLRHHTVRSFTDAPVSDEAITAMVAAAQSAASSSNLQLWSVVEVRDAATRRALVDEVDTSTFVADAPVILLFVADWARASAIAAAEGESDTAADYLESTLVAFVDAALAAQTPARPLTLSASQQPVWRPARPQAPARAQVRALAPVRAPAPAPQWA